MRQTLLAVVRRAVRAVVGAHGASVVVRGRQGFRYWADAAVGPQWQRSSVGACVSGWVIENARSAIIEDVSSDARVHAEAFRASLVKSLAVVPIGEASAVGALGAYWASRHRASEYEALLLEALGQATARSLALGGVRSIT